MQRLLVACNGDVTVVRYQPVEIGGDVISVTDKSNSLFLWHQLIVGQHIPVASRPKRDYAGMSLIGRWAAGDYGCCPAHQ
jgi:hypothetical protein